MAPTTTTPKEIKRLRAKCHEVLKGANETDREQEALDLEMQSLRDRDQLLTEKAFADRIEAADVFSELAQIECLELCAKVHKALPREIRDTIYSFVTGAKNVYIACNTPFARSCDEHAQPSKSLSCCVPNNVKAAHWWKPEYMGAQMAREIGENYYRSSHFKFEFTMTNVIPFRAIDHFDLGFAPVEFISTVEVTINCRDYQFEAIEREYSHIPADIHSLSTDSEETGWGSRRCRETPKHLFVELESLFGFRQGTGITINLLSRICENVTLLEQLEWMAYTVVPVIFPVLQRLKDTGCRARILLSAEDEWSMRSFTSKWNPKSSEAINQDVQEYVKVEQDRLSQDELGFTVVSDEESEPSTASTWDATAFAGEEVTSDNADEA